MCFVFFFQAEDGIRDGTVTGVQTCALPISARALERNARPRKRALDPYQASARRADVPDHLVAAAEVGVRDQQVVEIRVVGERVACRRHVGAAGCAEDQIVPELLDEAVRVRQPLPVGGRLGRRSAGRERDGQNAQHECEAPHRGGWSYLRPCGSNRPGYGRIRTCTSRRVDEPASRFPCGVRARTNSTSAPFLGALVVGVIWIWTVPSWPVGVSAVFAAQLRGSPST